MPVPADGRHVIYTAAAQVELADSYAVSDHTFSNGIGIITYSAVQSSLRKTLMGTNITGISLHPSCTVIAYQSLSQCHQLAVAQIPGVINLNPWSFFDNNVLNFNTLPNFQTIGDYAFRQCYALSITEMPSTVTAIGKDAFKTCTGLTTLTFLGTPTSINATAFAECRNLSAINVPWSEGTVANAPWGATNATITYDYA